MNRIYSPLETLEDPLFEEKKVTVWVKRDDLVHPTISGNKWRKLKYNLARAKENGCTTLVTLGGAFSNHIEATARAAKEFSFSSVGIIRGDELTEESNLTLHIASSMGMSLKFVTREEFRILRANPDKLYDLHPSSYVLPEGGTNELAVKGCEEIIEEIGTDFDFVCTSIGTGGTMAGLIKGLRGLNKVLAFPSLKGAFINGMISDLLDSLQIPFRNYSILPSYHFGGYAKTSDELIDFMNSFKERHAIQLDPIYTGKLFFGVIDLIKEGYFKENSRIVLLHTGGLQGVRGYNSVHRKKIL